MTANFAEAPIQPEAKSAFEKQRKDSNDVIGRLAASAWQPGSNNDAAAKTKQPAAAPEALALLQPRVPPDISNDLKKLFGDFQLIGLDAGGKSKTGSNNESGRDSRDKNKEPRDKDKEPRDKDKEPKDKDKEPKDKDKEPKDKDKEPKDKDKEQRNDGKDTKDSELISRDSQRRVSEHRFPNTAARLFDIKYTDEKSSTVSRVEFSKDLYIARDADGGYTLHDALPKPRTEKLSSVSVDQKTGDLEINRAGGDSLIYMSTGGTKHVNEAGKVDVVSFPGGSTFYADKSGKLQELETHRSTASDIISADARADAINRNKPYRTETLANGDVVENYDRYKLTTKPDKTRIYELGGVANAQTLTITPDGRQITEFCQKCHTTGRKRITTETNNDRKEEFEGRPDGLKSRSELANGQVVSTFEGRPDGLKSMIQFPNGDAQKRTSRTEYDGKTVTSFREGEEIIQAIEYTKSRDDKITRVSVHNDGSRDLQTSDGKVRRDGVPVSREVKDGENGLKRVTEQKWEDLDPPGGPSKKRDLYLRTNEYEGRKDGVVKEIEHHDFTYSHMVIDNPWNDLLTHVNGKEVHYTGRADGLIKSIDKEGEPTAVKNISWYKDRTVVKYEDWRDYAQMTYYNNVADDGKVSETIYRDGDTSTEYKNGRITFHDRTGKEKRNR